MTGTYSGILDCLQRTVEVEGFRALYKARAGQRRVELRWALGLRGQRGLGF